tara:strand:+ start:135 stop:1187 length:1053 start_codon:yes stop_codon:yes gene_type:complete
MGILDTLLSSDPRTSRIRQGILQQIGPMAGRRPIAPTFGEIAAGVVAGKRQGEREFLQEEISKFKYVPMDNGQIGKINLMDGSIEMVGTAEVKEPKQRDIKINELVTRGVPRTKAIDIVDENMEIDISKEGIVTVYDKITNTVEKYGGPLSDSTLVTQSDDFSIQPTDLSSKQIDEEKMNISTSEKIIPKLREISTRASDIFGTGNKFKDITAGLAGVTPKFFDKYLIDPDVVQAKKDYGLIKKELELSLTNNPRFPVAEVNRILDLLPNEKSFIQDPQSGAIALNTIANEIQQKLDESKSLLSGSKITTDIMQGSGVQISPFEPKTQEDLDKIKSGQYFIYNGEIRIMK